MQTRPTIYHVITIMGNNNKTKIIKLMGGHVGGHKGIFVIFLSFSFLCVSVTFLWKQKTAIVLDFIFLSPSIRKKKFAQERYKKM